MTLNTREIGQNCANYIIKELRKAGYDASEYEEYMDNQDYHIIDCIIPSLGKPKRIEIKCRNLPQGIIGYDPAYTQFKFYRVDRVDFVICHFIGHPNYLWTFPSVDFKDLAPEGSLSIGSDKKIKELIPYQGFKKLPK